MSNLRVLDTGFGDSFETAMRRFLSRLAVGSDTPALKMRIDVSEKDEPYLVKADIPGVKKEDIDVRIDGNIVQIDAEPKREKDTRTDGDKILRSERYWGNVPRTFSVSQDIDDAKAQAKYADGVLTLELPKKSTAASKKVTVQ
jgi:HSP20 family protein